MSPKSAFTYRDYEALPNDRDRYVLAATVAGADPADLPPFTGLGLVPDTLWP